MINNILGLVQPLEKRFKGVFEKKWGRGISKIRSLSPGDLECMDSEIKKLELLYEISGIKSTKSAGQNDYLYTLQRLKADQADIILKKFKITIDKIDLLLGNPTKVKDAEIEAKRFDEALSQFSLLKALYHRWSLHSNKHRSVNEDYDYNEQLKHVAVRLAKKRKLLMEEKLKRKQIIAYQNKTKILGEIADEMSNVSAWYERNYLNVEGKNPLWSPQGAVGVPVDYIDSSDHVAPLELLKKVPSRTEIEHVQFNLRKFIDHYFKNSMIDLKELEILEDYERLLEYSASFDINSEDSEHRLKTVLFDKLLEVHRVLNDARSRSELKSVKDEEFNSSFAMYFAPVEEVYRILRRGYISSDDAVKSTESGSGLVLDLNAEIKSGDMGFIFPVTRICKDLKFTQLSSEDSDELHLFTKDGSSVKIDVRDGFFVAPKNRPVEYSADGKKIKETCEKYFVRFFSSLGNSAEWFDGDRAKGWHDRHCFFYTDKERKDLLGLLKKKDFASVFSNFSRKSRDDLSLSQLPGTLSPTDSVATVSFSEGVVTRPLTVTLFEWKQFSNA